MDIYKFFWKPFGRPFTFMIRDCWHKIEFVWIIGLVAVGVCMGHHYDWITVLKVIGIFTVGFIFGHLLWGKSYIPGEGTDKEGEWNG